MRLTYMKASVDTTDFFEPINFTSKNNLERAVNIIEGQGYPLGEK